MKHTIIAWIALGTMSFSLCSMDQQKNNDFNDITENNPEIIMDYSSSSKSKKNYCSYKECSTPYNVFSCEERCLYARCPALTGGICLATREMGTLVHSCGPQKSCSDVHTLIWCSKSAWFPCLCGSCGKTCLSIAVNSASVITFGSILRHSAYLLLTARKHGLKKSIPTLSSMKKATNRAIFFDPYFHFLPKSLIRPHV